LGIGDCWTGAKLAVPGYVNFLLGVTCVSNITTTTATTTITTNRFIERDQSRKQRIAAL